ncbi:MAG: hypothetical protein ISS57_11400 [Anaerolineales bacterium]|nr:hypothetical protein [Chloroflexota bacterium]MBL7163203.1 hypothetical protein [Anaerolineales bacterium]
MTKLDKEIVLKTMRGFAEVNRITEAERRERLKTMTEDQAKQIFDDLNIGVTEMTEGEKSRLADFRLKHHLKVRKAMEMLARSNGYEPKI